MIGLHRITYANHNNLTLDSISGKVVRHMCDNTRCINPHHLLIGTQVDNLKDMQDRGRNPKGEEHWLSKLTWETVALIRFRCVPGCKVNGCSALARELGVSHQEVSAVFHNKIWRLPLTS